MSKCSLQEQHKELEHKWWQHKCCALCVVNTSHCVGSATAVGMLAIGGLWIFLSSKFILMLFIINRYCVQLLLVVVMYVKWRIGSLSWICTACNIMDCWELLCFAYTFLNICILMDIYYMLFYVIQCTEHLWLTYENTRLFSLLVEGKLYLVD